MRLEQIRSVTILGTGMMGPGVALLFARAGYETTIWGRTESSAARGMAGLQRSLSDLVAEGIVAPQQQQALLSGVKSSSNLGEAVSDADFITETVVEDLEVKQRLFARVERVCPAHAILSSNTSTLSPTALGAKIESPERVIVTHFWNPAHLVPLVEVCGGTKTSQQTVRATMQLMEAIGKRPVLVKKEVPGFIGNRLMHAMNREALSLIEKGVVEPEDIDRVVLTSFGPRFANLGPMEYLDFVGLDLVGCVQGYLYGDLDAEPGRRRILEEKIKRGELGMKSGRGLFDWSRRDPDDVRARRDKEFIRRMKAVL